METSPTTDVAKEEILADAEGLQIAMDGVYATMYNRLDFVAANAHQCFGNMAVTLAADLMGDEPLEDAVEDDEFDMDEDLSGIGEDDYDF